MTPLAKIAIFGYPPSKFCTPSSPFNSILERSHSIAIFAFFFRYFSSTLLSFAGLAFAKDVPAFRRDPRERARPRPAPPSALVRAPSHSHQGCDIFVGPWDGPDRVMEDS